MNAAILAIGDELTLGQVVDTNTAWLAARLAELGIHATLHLTVSDDRAAIVRALRTAAESHALVLITGGLGPTDDDLTRPALAELLGAPLELHPPSLHAIETFFHQRHREMPERNRLQALCPVGAKMLENPVGTAPGIHARVHDTDIFCVPGVPHEMHKLFELHIAPFLATGPGRVILSAKVNTFGAGESTVADLLGELMDRGRNPLVGTTVSQGFISARIRSEFPGRDEASDRLEATVRLVRDRLGEIVFGRDDETLQEAAGKLLNKADTTLSTAESCTGGLLGKMLTDVGGCSKCYLGGFITYHNDAKMDELGVPAEMLKKHGAVSEPVARAMAEGCRRRLDTDYALSITGVAGPAGGTPEKPVGTVWIALASRDQTTAHPHLFAGDRDTIRDRSAKTALNTLRLELLKSI